MRKSFSKLNAVLLAVLLCASVLPQNAAADETATDHFAFGIEYDWSNMNDDFESMTGLPLDDILTDVMQSADDAGIELLLLEEVTGSSSIIIDQYEDGTTMFDAADGSSVEVTKHVTELTIRHGGLMDMAMITEWSDARAGWDLTISGGNEGIFNADAHYIEYRDSAGLIYGHDIDMSMNTEQSIFFDFVGHIEADDGDHVLPLDIHMEMGVDYAVTSAESSVVYTEPSTIYQQLSDLEGGEDLHWEIGNDDDEYIWWDSYDGSEWTCTWDSSYEEYYCEHTDGWGDWPYYCEYYSAFDEYMCTYDFGRSSDWENSLSWTHYNDDTSPNTGEQAEPHSGSFSTTTGFNFELTGLPAEELGFPEGKWDVSASDSVTDPGTFTDEEYFCEMGIDLFEGTQMITTDGDQIEVMQAHTSPLPWAMSCHVANLMIHAIEGTEGTPAFVDMFEDSTEEIAESMGGDSYSQERGDNDMLWVEMDVYAQDDISISVEAWDLDESIDYEITLVLTDSDGITQDATSIVVNDDYYFYDWDHMSSTSWGEHCLTAQLKDVTNNDIVDSLQTCAEIAQEPEPSDLLMDIIDGFSESTIENVMENFGSNLEYRLEDYEADFPYDDGDMFVLWDTTNNMVVGFQLVVTSEDSNMWYTLIGPDSDSYGTAPSPVSVTYFSGQQAIAQEAEIEDDSTLEDLVDLTQHNDEVIEQAIEDSLEEDGNDGSGDGSGDGEEADDGLLPFISPTLTIAMIAVAGLVASLRERKD